MRLGAFELGPEIGQGGMGRVFRGRHARSGAPVAIKVLSAERSRAEAQYASFRDEVRAVAALDHPGIVMVFDQGRVDPEAALASRRTLGVGAPYLVMELLPHGTLNDLGRGPDGARAPIRFPRLRAILLDLLDALAHAHARGVVHRDLKPGNVLLTGGDDPWVKLTDFGIAHRLEAFEVDRHVVSGTPHYMAPEQVEGRARELGPWTDLYALGCVAWRLATGRPPFFAAGNDVAETLRRQVEAPLPPLESLAPLPSAFVEWLHTCLAKPWDARFRCAADAAATLAEIPLDEDLVAGSPTFDLGFELAALPPTDEQATRAAAPKPIDPRPFALAAERTVAWSEPRTEDPTLVFVPMESERPPARSQIKGRVPSFPREHEPRSRGPRPLAMSDAGLGLFALRPGPMVDRVRERDRLWQLLGEVHRDRLARAVVVRGASGVGKTRLCDWFATRAREVGAATVLSARHAPLPGAADGVGPMLARHLGTTGLARGKALEPTLAAVRRHGGRLADAVPLLELTHPSTDETDGPRVRFGNPRERTHAVLRYLELLSHERPVLLRVDDVQWGAWALEVVEACLSSTRPLPVLCLLDVADDALVERAEEARALDRIAGPVLSLEPLPPAEQSALLTGLLSLRPEVTSTLVQRSGGRPLFAVQLLADWVQRGLLEPHEDGFAPAEGASLDVPDTLHALLLSRVRSALPASSSLVWLERAAVLGRAFDPGEWSRACGGEPFDDLVAAMSMHGWFVREAEHLAFAHGMMVESLVRRAREEGRLAAHHLACADAVGSRERRARHLAAAGEPARALDPMFEAAWARFETSDYVAAVSLLEERERWVSAAAEDDPRRAEGVLRLGLVHARTGKLQEASACLDRVEAFERAHPNPRLAAEALHARAKVAQMDRRILDAIAGFEQAIERFGALDAQRGIGQAEHGLAEVLKQGGRAGESEPHYLRALDGYRRAGDRVGEASCLLGWAELVTRTDRARGGELVDRAEPALRAVGNRLGLAIAEQIRALSARYDGRLEEAHSALLRCAEMLDAIGSTDAWVARNNAGVVDVLLGNWARATRAFEDCLRVFAQHGRTGDSCYATVELLACRAHAHDWTSFDELLVAVETKLPNTGLVDEDLEICLRLAHEEAMAAGETARAARIAPLWAEQRARLGA